MQILEEKLGSFVDYQFKQAAVMKAMLSLRDFSESIPIVQQMSVYALFDVFVLHILVNIARIPT